MKVTQNPIPTTAGLETGKASERSRAQKTEQNKASTPASTRESADVAISDAAHLMQEAREIAHGAQAAAPDRVAELKQRIKEGSYHVDSRAVADRLVDEHLASHFGKNTL